MAYESTTVAVEKSQGEIRGLLTRHGAARFAFGACWGLAMWADERLLAFDVETTSVDVETARIVQAAQVYVGGGRETDSTVLWIDPGVPIPEEASAVHGITAGTLEVHGAMDAPAAMDKLAHMIDLAIGEGVPIVAYNARYDLTILDRELRRHGLLVPDWSAARVIDPHVLDKWLHRFRRGSRKLADVCEHYGVTLEDAHDAGADALAAARLAYVLAKRANFEARHPEVIAGRAEWKRIRGDLDALHVAQVRMAADQARGLRDYFERQGKMEEAASVVEDWPIVPVREEATT
jgi:DNA polymerase-3 subunit epsilon